jgi:ketosteroid isomerase-like protein
VLLSGAGSDDERILVFTRRRGRGRTSGVELEHIRTPGAGLFHIRDGKVVRFVLYWDGSRAVADLGLAPDERSADS